MKEGLNKIKESISIRKDNYIENVKKLAENEDFQDGVNTVLAIVPSSLNIEEVFAPDISIPQSNAIMTGDSLWNNIRQKEEELLNVDNKVKPIDQIITNINNNNNTVSEITSDVIQQAEAEGLNQKASQDVIKEADADLNKELSKQLAIDRLINKTIGAGIGIVGLFIFGKTISVILLKHPGTIKTIIDETGTAKMEAVKTMSTFITQHKQDIVNIGYTGASGYVLKHIVEFMKYIKR